VDSVLRIDYHINNKLEGDEFSDIDEQSHPHVKVQDAFYYVQIFFKFVVDNPWDFGELKEMNIWRFLGKLNKMSIVNTSSIFEILFSIIDLLLPRGQNSLSYDTL